MAVAIHNGCSALKGVLAYWQAALILLGQSENEIPLRQDSYEEKILAEAKVDFYRLSNSESITHIAKCPLSNATAVVVIAVAVMSAFYTAIAKALSWGILLKI
jgi:hypothetical protein